MHSLSRSRRLIEAYQHPTTIDALGRFLGRSELKALKGCVAVGDVAQKSNQVNSSSREVSLVEDSISDIASGRFPRLGCGNLLTRRPSDADDPAMAEFASCPCVSNDWAASFPY